MEKNEKTEAASKEKLVVGPDEVDTSKTGLSARAEKEITSTGSNRLQRVTSSLRTTRSRILPDAAAPPRQLVTRRLAAHFIDACMIAMTTTVFFVVFLLSQDLSVKQNMGGVLSYLTNIPHDIATGFFTPAGIFAAVLGIWLLSFLNGVLPGSVAFYAFLALLFGSGEIPTDDLSPRAYVAVQLVYLFTPLLYNVLFVYYKGTTPGKRFVGLSMISHPDESAIIDESKGKLSLGNITAREVMRMLYLDLILPWWFPLSYLFKWKRTDRMLYDRLACTEIESRVPVDTSVITKKEKRYDKRASLVLFSAAVCFLSLVYMGLLQEPVAIIVNKFELKVLKATNGKLYAERLADSVIYRDRDYFTNSERSTMRLNEDIPYLERVVSVINSRGLDRKKLLRPYLQLGLLYQMRGNYAPNRDQEIKDEKASAKWFEDYLKLAAELHAAPDSESLARDWSIPDLNYQMAELYLRLDQYDESIRAAERSLHQNSEGARRVRPFVYYAMIKAYDRINDKESVIETLGALRDYYQGELDKALAGGGDIKRVHPIYQDLFNAYLRLGGVLSDLDRADQARQQVKFARLLYDKYGASSPADLKDLDDLVSRIAKQSDSPQ